MQFSGLAYACGAKHALPTRPEILFVLAPDEPFEVDPPDHVTRLHEVECGEGNADGKIPAFLPDSSFGGPDSIPAGIPIAEACVGSLLLGNQGVSLGAKWVDLKDVCIAAIMGRIDDDFEVVVQFLADISP